jgi:hypothetical protein
MAETAHIAPADINPLPYCSYKALKTVIYK